MPTGSALHPATDPRRRPGRVRGRTVQGVGRSTTCGRAPARSMHDGARCAAGRAVPEPGRRGRAARGRPLPSHPGLLVVDRPRGEDRRLRRRLRGRGTCSGLRAATRHARRPAVRAAFPRTWDRCRSARSGLADESAWADLYRRVPRLLRAPGRRHGRPTTWSWASRGDHGLTGLVAVDRRAARRQASPTCAGSPEPRRRARAVPRRPVHRPGRPAVHGVGDRAAAGGSCARRAARPLRWIAAAHSRARRLRGRRATVAPTSSDRRSAEHVGPTLGAACVASGGVRSR